MRDPQYVVILQHNKTLHTLNTISTPYTPQLCSCLPIFQFHLLLPLQSYVDFKIESILYVTSLGDNPDKPIISFAHISILTLSEQTKLIRFGDPLSNFILFLSYHNDHITHPRISPHSFWSFRFLTNPIHWMVNVLLCFRRTPKIFHHSSIFIQEHHENFHVNRM